MARSRTLESAIVQVERPQCPNFGKSMWLARITLADKPDYDERTFECPSCDHQEVILVKYR